MKKMKKLIAVFLVVVMCACYAPLFGMTSSAAEAEPISEAAVDESNYTLVMSIVGNSVTVLLSLITGIFKLTPFGANAGSNNGTILDIVLNATKLIYQAANQPKE